ncbi:chaperonin-like RbcX protein 2, chloroplastic [Nymphaea colorata]|nr:chaperonin-like RbcX protein 2, chloroplastic [Nymphaea colorata]
MVVALSVDPHMRPRLCGSFSSTVDALALSGGNSKSMSGRFCDGAGCSVDLGLYRVRLGRREPKLSSAFTNSWCEWRLASRVLSGLIQLRERKQRGRRDLLVVDELGGQYEENFDDVKKQLLNYFTYKAVRTVLNQLYEMNPTQYRWFYDFVVTNKPGDGRLFIRSLGKEKQDLAERVMVTRLHLYSKWVKKYDHAEMYQEISDQNLELMRERLMETVKWPSDDTNTGKI